MIYQMLVGLRRLNYTLIILAVLTASLGFAMMFSAAGGSWSPWAGKQIIRFALAFGLMIAIAITPQKLLFRYAYVIYFACLIVLIGIEIAGFIGKGAKRWVDVGGVNLQPSEFMKLAVILALARYFHSQSRSEISRLIRLLPAIAMILVPAMFILRQPNLGTATILVFVATFICFMAGVKARYFVIIIALGLAAAPVGWHFLHDYQKQRVMTFLHPEEDPLGSGYNIMQSMIAIGSGGLFGKGYMNGSQGQLDFLPEKHTDFIFTMIGEEFGFVGCAVVICLYLAMIAYCVAIGLRSRNLFGSLIGFGVAAMLFIHITINMMMVMGLIPVVGVPLPLLSYG
ncbi:MAG: rod shape-determining protein RodA, partial [Pseudomonadota bacterium]